MNQKSLVLAALLVCATLPAAAQTTPAPLLSGTTGTLSWGLYAGGLTDLQTGDNRLRLSAPEQAKVLGTRYDAGTRTALITYRPPPALDVRGALDFAAAQLQRQGFELTFRVYLEGARARALLRRTDRLVEVQMIQGASGTIQALYQFRSGDLPLRLLAGEAPDNLRVYADPIDLKTVQIVPGRIFLTPPGNVLIDSASYHDRRASLLFYGNYTLKDLEDFYLPFFKSQGFVETSDRDSGERSRTYQLARSSETYSLTLNASDATSRSRVTLGP
ncbi:hypothetical protein [Deinococcus humi]|uniref:Uncharacterized protein n=1 Tax=Deinococcus humi TaxID=662880 RepID=A0A7W8NJ25_9DEIO|nr:hypothetical protein [Deinococcus humi]MBB5366433.1 hypothetical protein [Deinococcus humi]GGO41934.1 hypothetical protein GCM10008949_53390 [Deinococcus humi]